MAQRGILASERMAALERERLRNERELKQQQLDLEREKLSLLAPKPPNKRMSDIFFKKERVHAGSGDPAHRGIRGDYDIEYSGGRYFDEQGLPRRYQEKMVVFDDKGQPHEIAKTRGSLLESIRREEGRYDREMGQTLLGVLAGRMNASSQQDPAIQALLGSYQKDPASIQGGGIGQAYRDTDILSHQLTGRPLSDFVNPRSYQGLLPGGMVRAGAKAPRPPELPDIPTPRQQAKIAVPVEIPRPGAVGGDGLIPSGLDLTQRPTPAAQRQGALAQTTAAPTIRERIQSGLERTDVALKRFFGERGKKIPGEVAATGQAITEKFKSLIPQREPTPIQTPRQRAETLFPDLRVRQPEETPLQRSLREERREFIRGRGNRRTRTLLGGTL